MSPELSAGRGSPGDASSSSPDTMLEEDEGEDGEEEVRMLSNS